MCLVCVCVWCVCVWRVCVFWRLRLCLFVLLEGILLGLVGSEIRSKPPIVRFPYFDTSPRASAKNGI